MTYLPSSSYAITASAATSITFVPPTASYALTASVALNSGGAVVSASYSTTSSYASNTPTPVNWVTGSYTASLLDLIISVSASTATSSIYLPGTTLMPGDSLLIRVSNTNNNWPVVVVPSGSETIDGLSSIVLNTARATVSVTSNGRGEWMAGGSGSYAGIVLTATSASYALSASYAPSTGGGSTLFFGNYSGSFSGSLSGSASITGSLVGSASYANTSSLATTVKSGRQTVSFTTPSITTNTVYSASLDFQAQQWSLLIVSASNNSRVCVYNTSQSMVNDMTRPTSQQPSASAGILLDAILTSSLSREIGLAPTIIGYNYEKPTTTMVSLNITNYEVASTAITVTFTYISL